MSAARPPLTKARRAWVASLKPGDRVWVTGPHGRRHAHIVRRGAGNTLDVSNRPLTAGGVLRATWRDSSAGWIEPMTAGETEAAAHEERAAFMRGWLRMMFGGYGSVLHLTPQDCAELEVILVRIEEHNKGGAK